MTVDEMIDSKETWSADLADAEFADAIARTRVVTPLTRALVVLLILGVGFAGGVMVERTQTPAAAATTGAGGAAFRNAAGGAGGAAGAGGGGGGAGGATVGTVTLVDGANVYVTTAQGDVVKVTTTPQTSISVSKSGTLTDLDPSKTVVVQGSTNADGSVSATSISEGTFGAFGGGGGGRRGGGGGGAASTASGG